MSQYNMRNPAVKRLMREAQELLHPTDEYHAQPLEDNLFEWHFTIRGPPNSDYDGGIYHGRITLPPDYPMKPPSIILLTPNGRFETNKKICLSISGHHPESWQPSWSIRTALLAIIGFMPTHGNGALGSLDYTPEERQQLAARSKVWQCSECGYIKDIFVKKIEEPPEKEEQQECIPPSETCNPEIPYVRPVGSETLITEISDDATSSQNESEPVPFNENASFVVPTEDTRPSVPSKDEETSLVHRKNDSKIPENNIEERHTSDQSRNNFFYSAFVIVIISIIVFLCLRRLFCM